MTPAIFRQAFPEFIDPDAYPDAQVALWLSVAGSMVSAERWGEIADLGMQLFTAHHLVIGQQDQAAASVGAAPGKVTGPQTAKAVDKVSASYDTSATTYEDAGFWNMTSYGVRFYSLLRLFGAGGIQL